MRPAINSVILAMLFGLCGCSSNCATSAHRAPQTGIPPLRWGYVNRAGKVAIFPQFDEAQKFSEGLAAVRIGKKWGYVDQTGKMVIPAKYDLAEPFQDGLALVAIGVQHLNEAQELGEEPIKNRPKAVFLDKSGKPAFSPAVGEYPRFSEGLAKVGFGMTSYIDSMPAKYGYINKKGALAIAPRVFISAGDFSEGLAVVKTKTTAGSKYGYIDKSGHMAIAPKYDLANAFSEGLAAVNVKGKTGYIDKHGRMIIKPTFDQGGDFHSQRAVVRQRHKEGHGPVFLSFNGFVDSRGDLRVTNKRIVDADDFSEELAKFVDKDTSMTGFIDVDGHVKIKPQYDKAMSFHEGLAMVQIGDEYGYIDKQGKMVIPLSPLACLGSQSYIDYDRKEVEEKWSFSDGLAPWPVRH